MINQPQIPQRDFTPFVPEPIKYYFIFEPEIGLGGFYDTSNHRTIPEGAIEITLQRKQELLNDINSNNKLIYLDNEGVPQLRDRLTKLVDGEWVSDEDAIAERAQTILIMQARQLLSANAHRWNNNILYESYSVSVKDEIVRFHNALMEVINGESSELPVLDLEILRKNK